MLIHALRLSDQDSGASNRCMRRLKYQPARGVSELRVWVDHAHLPQSMPQRLLEVLGSTIILAELLLEVGPTDLRAPRIGYSREAMGEPRVDVQGECRVFEGSQSPEVERHGVPGESVEEVLRQLKLSRPQRTRRTKKCPLLRSGDAVFLGASAVAGCSPPGLRSGSHPSQDAIWDARDHPTALAPVTADEAVSAASISRTWVDSGKTWFDSLASILASKTSSSGRTSRRAISNSERDAGRWCQS